MPFEHDYGDSASKRNPENSDNWQSIGDVAARMAERSSPAMDAITDIMAIYSIGAAMGLTGDQMDAAIHEKQPMDQDAITRAFEEKCEEVGL